MNILVCISSVPDTTSKINFTDDNTKFDKNGIQFVINPYDEFGLTKAIKIKENISSNITVITVGNVTTEPILRKALAMGADKAIRINKDPNDSYSTAIEIANFLKKNPADLIIAGRESIDYNGGAVPAMIAEMLMLPFINACIELNISGKTVNMTRDIEGGKEIITGTLPLVIGGQKGLVEESELIIPNMRGIMQARTKILEVLDPIDNQELVTLIKFEKPATKSTCKLIDANNVSKLISLLKNEAKVI